MFQFIINLIDIKQWGKGQEVGLTSTLEWSFDGQIMIKNEISLTSTFPQLSQVKFEIYHNTEWEIAEIFETKGLLVIDQQKYTVLLKGIISIKHLFVLVVSTCFCLYRRESQPYQALGIFGNHNYA